MKYIYPLELLEKFEQYQWLTDHEKSVFAYYFKRGWHIEDIAAELGVHRSTIDRTLRQIRDKISKHKIL